MKKTSSILAIAATIVTGNALAADTEAYVLASKPPAYGMIPAANMIYALMLKDPCLLPIANAKNMRMAAIFNNKLRPDHPDIGCWGRTLHPSKAEVFVIGPTGEIISGISLTAFVRATINRDGDGTALGPAITPEDFRKNIDEYQKSIR
ncbi:hypothetical protein [Burkholderia vietnamiensis]|uniref:hypothetical protein n=1 Tax=Burkholderia vietnamiensis TaxID=60552 RepID=UPI00159415B7|nr:hypothetical protein [Burkholderia vietnamiensis]